ncbi:MAG: Fe-S cluster assembly protein NifU [Lentisphaeria bacterium]|nr:Fe-S cluster assembly protein NifU [Lentisphaeria bacterium]
MWDYTDKVMQHFLHPHNVGELADADGVGEVGNISCGDALKLYIKLDENKQKIIDAKFQTFGCASAIASASALTDLVIGMPLSEAEKLSNQDIADFLGQLPEEKMHCSVMGMEALQAAIANFRGESDGKVTPGDDDHDHYDREGLDRIICYCFGVTERKIRDVVTANNLSTVEDVIHYCKAGGGCGGCRPDIEDILASLKDEKDAVAKAAGAEESAAAKPMTNIQRIMLIQKVVDEEIRPGLKSDGGDMELLDVNGDRVIVKLTGACAGCPGAHVTLKRWVEAKLREQVSPKLVVEEITP